MKKLLVIALLGLAFAGKAQSIAPVQGNTNVVVNGNGNITINGQLKAVVAQDGTIKNASQVTIGQIVAVNNDFEIKNAAGVTVGYFKYNYDVTDANNVVIGHLRTNLSVKTAANVQIGSYVDNIAPVWHAVGYFFINNN